MENSQINLLYPAVSAMECAIAGAAAHYMGQGVIENVAAMAVDRFAGFVIRDIASFHVCNSTTAFRELSSTRECLATTGETYKYFLSVGAQFVGGIAAGYYTMGGVPIYTRSLLGGRRLSFRDGLNHPGLSLPIYAATSFFLRPFSIGGMLLVEILRNDSDGGKTHQLSVNHTDMIALENVSLSI
jgi:hypothetical protein